MTGAQAARVWMLLQTERSLGLESVPWKLTSNLNRENPAPPATVQPRRLQPSAAPALACPTPTRAASPAPSINVTQPAPRRVIPRKPVHAAMDNTPLQTGEPLTLPQRISVLASLDTSHVKGCTKCRLSETRTNTVFGEGAPDASLMFIGEGPGQDEDETGHPFVGRSGQLLGKMIVAMGLTREQVYIVNIVKCRPPGNRTPASDEVAACVPYLLQQIETIRPRVIVTLGLPATQYLLATDRPMRDLRGVWHEWRGVKVMPTYHPSYVLRSYTPEVRGCVWGDLQRVMQELGLPIKSPEFTR